VDFEAELAVVIGRQARNVPESQALEYVLGYSAANDISARRWQKHGGGGQWIRGKGFDGFCPIGPVLVTADEIPNPQDLWVRSILNGEIMQDGHTADMLYSVARLISLLSQDTTLLPGRSFSPAPRLGWVFRVHHRYFYSREILSQIEIAGIGRLENHII